MSGRRDLPPLMRTPLIRTPDEEDPLTGELLYRGHGHPQDRREDTAWMTAWGRLRKNQPLGKTVNFAYDNHGVAIQKAQETILRINGDDADAQQVTLTLNSPRACALPFSHLLAQSPGSIPGSQDNIQFLERGNFPGTAAPIIWPPFYALVRWGTGGTQSEALVDFVNGTTINLVVSYLNVDAYAFLGRADPIGTGALYALSAFVGPGFARPGVAQYTSQVGVIASHAESDVFPVPRDAKRATVVGCDSTIAPSVPVTAATLRFWRSPSGQAGGQSAGNFVVSGSVPGSFDVPNGAAYASVINGMAGEARFAIVYELAI